MYLHLTATVYPILPFLFIIHFSKPSDSYLQASQLPPALKGEVFNLPMPGKS